MDGGGYAKAGSTPAVEPTNDRCHSLPMGQSLPLCAILLKPQVFIEGSIPVLLEILLDTLEPHPSILEPHSVLLEKRETHNQAFKPATNQLISVSESNIRYDLGTLFVHLHFQQGIVTRASCMQ